MSSSDSSSIYENAAGVATFKLRDQPGVETIARAFLAKARLPGDDPRQERSLFFEPFHESQIHSVPLETTTKLAVELFQCGALRAWTRIRCPERGGENDIVAEVDEEEQVQSALQQHCPLCGESHGHDWLIELVYAVNRQHGPPPPFALGRPMSLDLIDQVIPAALEATFKGGTPATHDVILKSIAVVHQNLPLAAVTPLSRLLANDTGKYVFGFIGCLIVLTVAGAVLDLTQFFALVILTGAVLYLVIGRRYAEKAAVTRVERNLSRGLLFILAATTAKGMCGLNLEFGGGASSEIDFMGQKIIVPCKGTVGATDWYLIGAAIAVSFVIGTSLIGYRYVYGKQMTRKLTDSLPPQT